MEIEAKRSSAYEKSNLSRQQSNEPRLKSHLPTVLGVKPQQSNTMTGFFKND